MLTTMLWQPLRSVVMDQMKGTQASSEPVVAHFRICCYAEALLRRQVEPVEAVERLIKVLRKTTQIITDSEAGQTHQLFALTIDFDVVQHFNEVLVVIEADDVGVDVGVGVVVDGGFENVWSVFAL